ncbi:hypothetical protein G9A89_007566 [Geosiphon pyriformis]|nr:hypothetical protein G9A89_007566 [Geosiphon pyriformis]
METNMHDIWDFVRSVSEKTCIIDRHSVMYARARCAVVCFDSAELLDAAMRTMPVLRNTNLCWSRLISAKCAKCEKLGHTLLDCVVGGKFLSGNLLHRVFLNTDKSRLATIYAKCSASVVCPVSFGDEALPVTMEVDNRFAALEHSLASLAEQVSKLAMRLDTLGPTVPQPSSGCQLLVTPLSQDQGVDIVMSKGSGAFTGGGNVVEAVSFDMSLVSKLENSMKCLMETILGFSAKVNSIGIADKFDGVQVFTSGLDSGHLGADVAIVLDISLACHVCKISEGKLSVSILGLYAGAFSAVQFSQANKINSFIVKTVNESSFTVLGDDFNEDDSCRCASFRKCLDLGLANSLIGSPAVKMSTWANSRGVRKMIDYVLVSSNLVNAILHCGVSDAGEYFEMDHQAVSVSLGLGGLLDDKFRGATAVNAAMFSDDFIASQRFLDLDAMWDVVHKIMVLSADEVFKKKWFKDYDGVFTKESSKFHKLELLISKLVKASWSICCDKFILLLDVWGSLDVDNASVVKSLFLSSFPLDTVQSALSKVRKTYHSLKMAELRSVEESHIKSAIEKRMESFKLNKGHIIRSVLECLFHIVVLDHLVVDDELILEPGPVRLRTRKHRVVSNVPDVWHHQYWLLDYIFDEAFSGVMQPIEFLELFGMVSDLPIGKTAGLSGISNELWMHSNRSVLDMLWVLLNFCLSHESVSEGVLTNTQPIALIETARKILSKIFSDRILLVCSTHDILCGDNFLVLKSTTNQTPIFAIGLVDMRKVYDSVGWEHLKRCLVRIKMCGKFIRFFSNIHRNRTNRVIMNFSLTDDYSVHDGLDQGEVFSPLFWRIFYDLLLCEVKRQKSVYRYRLNSHFVSRSGHAKSQAGFSTFFTAGVFYLGIFLSTNGLSKPSLAKAHSDVCFFSNLVLKKAVSDKQFLYLVLAVLQPIVSYRMQFSFVPVSVCDKWDALIRKDLKLKSGLPLNFPSDTIHHPFFYGLKFFSQCQSESKIASLISFANSCGVLVLCWHSIHLLSLLAHIRVSISNNFLSDMVRVLLKCNLSLGGSLTSSFRFRDEVPMSPVLGKSLFLKYLPSLQHYGIAFVNQLRNCHGDIFDWYIFKWWKKLDPCDPVPEWFGHSVAFLSSASPSPLALSGVGPADICGSDGFVSVCNHLSWVGTDSLSVYTDELSLMSSTLAELQTVALALEYVPVDHSVHLFLDSQAALDACKLEVDLVCSDFRNRCWVKCQHIKNIIHRKNLKVSWHKVKGHFGVLRNNCANSITDTAVLSNWFLSPRVAEQFLLAGGGIVSGNSRHFVRDVFHSVCWMHWKVSSSSGFLAGDLCSNVDWLASSRVWHPDLHMATGFTSRRTADIRTYFMKALHHQLPMAV